MTKKIELAKNTLIIFLGKISTQFISFFLLPLYTSYLDTSDYGLTDLIITYISLLVPVITLQQEMATFRFLIDCRNDDSKKAKVIFNSFKSLLISTFLFVIVFEILSIFVKIPYKNFILFNVVITMFSGLLLQVSRGLGKNIVYSIASTITGISTLIFNIIFIVLLNFGAKGILLSTIVANLICFVFLIFVLKIHNFLNLKYNDRSLLKEMLNYSLPLVPNGISWWVINVSDRTIISSILSVSANGIYAVSTKFSSIINAIFSIFNMSFTESVSVHINDSDRDEFFSDIADTIVRIFSCLCILIITIMPFIFRIFIKDAYNGAFYYIPINLLAAFFNCIVGIYSSIYIAKKMSKKVASTSISSAIINIFINVIFIRLIGVYAACISTVVAYLAMAIYRHIDLKKYVCLSYKPLTLFITFFAFVIAFISYYINNDILNIIVFCLSVVYSIVVNKSLFNSFISRFKLMIFSK